MVVKLFGDKGRDNLMVGGDKGIGCLFWFLGNILDYWFVL